MTVLCRLRLRFGKDLSILFFDPVFSIPVHAMKLNDLKNRGSVLAWPAWLRVLAVLPVLVLLWLAVAWAQLEAAPW